ncbi:hypothetical protein CH370_18965 [Leptospira kmetyi]|uniref:hypothetical protein n=1 Tax=Leptospira kmetyi TaxID=408139 RepID=UPI000C2A53F5|nr:hypothetical protein [Leptospira kmetyi]PJZ39847.1 hypothetical protein CH370_18965 [Leptospira kmetyi]
MFFRTKTKFLAQFLLIGLCGFGLQTAVSASESETSEAREVFVHQAEVDRVLVEPVSNLSPLDQEDFFVLNSKSVVGTKINRVDAARKKIKALQEQETSFVSSNRSSDLSKFQWDLNCFSGMSLNDLEDSFVFVGTPAFKNALGSFEDGSKNFASFSGENLVVPDSTEGVVPTFEKNCPLISLYVSPKFSANTKIAAVSFPGSVLDFAIWIGSGENSSGRSSSLDESSKEFSLRSELRSTNGQDPPKASVVDNVGRFWGEEGGFSNSSVVVSNDSKRTDEKISSGYPTLTSGLNFLKTNSKKFDFTTSTSKLTPKYFSYKTFMRENLQNPKVTFAFFDPKRILT